MTRLRFFCKNRTFEINKSFIIIWLFALFSHGCNWSVGITGECPTTSQSECALYQPQKQAI